MSTYWWLTHSAVARETLNYWAVFCFSAFYPAMIEISWLEILVCPGCFLLLSWSWGLSAFGKRIPSEKYCTCQLHTCSIENIKAAATTKPFYKSRWRGFNQNRMPVNILHQAFHYPSWAIPATEACRQWDSMMSTGKAELPGAHRCPASGCRLPQLHVYLLLLFTVLTELPLKSWGFDTSQLWSIKTDL